MSRADGKRQRAVQARKHERERLRDERKKAKLEKRTGAAAAPEEVTPTHPPPLRAGEEIEEGRR